MSLTEIKQQFIKNQTELFDKLNLAFFPEVIVQVFDPFSSMPERAKVFQILENAWLRLAPDGEVKLDSVEHSYYVTKEVSEAYRIQLGIPFFHLEKTNIFASKLEADTLTKPLIVIPEKLEAQGALLPYGAPILQSLIAEAIVKFAKDHSATTEQVIDFLTEPPPYGGGWCKRTANLILRVKHTIQQMSYRGLLEYDENTQKYTFISKPSSTTVRR